jgi:NADH-quinone oxidoreductase E subunit
MSFIFTPENQAAFEQTLTRYPTRQAALLPALWLVQRQAGFISLEAQEYVGQLLDLSPAQVNGVVTFYSMYKQKPVGKYHLQICRTLSCALRGCGKITETVQDKLKIQSGEVTHDGKFSLELVECLASCGTAPVMQVNEAYFENLTAEKVKQLLDKLSS